MAIEIGNLVVRGSFGQSGRDDDTLSKDEMRQMMNQLRREMRDVTAQQIAASEQRIKEGLL